MVRLSDHPDKTLDVYSERKITTQHNNRGSCMGDGLDGLRT